MANIPPETQKYSRVKQQIRARIERAFTLTLDADNVSPDRIIADIYAILETIAPPKPIAENLAAVQDETIERFETSVLVQRPVTQHLVRAMQHRVKKLFFWSARDMANYLNIDRSTLKKIESGQRAPSQEFERRFRHLERHVAAWSSEQQGRERQTVIVESEFPMPRRYRIRRKLKSCRRCKKYFEPTRGNNILCHTKECEQRTKKRRRKQK